MKQPTETKAQQRGSLLSALSVLGIILGIILVFCQLYVPGIIVLLVSTAVFFSISYIDEFGIGAFLWAPFRINASHPLATPVVVFFTSFGLIVLSAITKTTSSWYMWILIAVATVSFIHSVIAGIVVGYLHLTSSRQGTYDDEDTRTDYEVLVDEKLPRLLINYYSPLSEFPVRKNTDPDLDPEVAKQLAEDERQCARLENAAAHIRPAWNGEVEEDLVKVILQPKEGTTLRDLTNTFEVLALGIPAYDIALDDEPIRELEDSEVAIRFYMKRQRTEMERLIEARPTACMYADHSRENLFSFPVGVNAFGEDIYLDLTHTLIAGVSRAGKGSPIQRILEYYAPLVKTGKVRLWGIDPKNAEFKAFRNSSLFHRLAFQSTEQGELIDEFHSEMKRKQGLSGRSGEVSPETPIDILIVDEIVAVVKNKNVMNSESYTGETRQLLWDEILTQGASDYSFLIAATQIVIASVLGDTRVNFINRIALRLTSANHVDIVLGDGAVRDEGAEAHKIPRATKGNGYFSAGIANVVGDDGIHLMRFAYTSDEDMQKLIDDFPPLAYEPIVDEGEDQSAAVEAFLSTLTED